MQWWNTLNSGILSWEASKASILPMTSRDCRASTIFACALSFLSCKRWQGLLQLSRVSRVFLTLVQKRLSGTWEARLAGSPCELVLPFSHDYHQLSAWLLQERCCLLQAGAATRGGELICVKGILSWMRELYLDQTGTGVDAKLATCWSSNLFSSVPVSSARSSAGVLVKLRPKSQAKSLSCTVIGISSSAKSPKVGYKGLSGLEGGFGQSNSVVIDSGRSLMVRLWLAVFWILRPMKGKSQNVQKTVMALTTRQVRLFFIHIAHPSFIYRVML